MVSNEDFDSVEEIVKTAKQIDCEIAKKLFVNGNYEGLMIVNPETRQAISLLDFIKIARSEVVKLAMDYELADTSILDLKTGEEISFTEFVDGIGNSPLSTEDLQSMFVDFQEAANWSSGL